jgi:hypothetical protein
MKTIKCPHCTRVVPVTHSQNVKPHLTPGQQRCPWGGMRADQTQTLNENLARIAAEKAQQKKKAR